MSAFHGLATPGFWGRTRAMLIKELIQLKRDRVSFAMIIMIPLMQLMLFGYAINTMPRHLPTAVLLQVAADATDPVAAGPALGALDQVVQTALQHDRALPDGGTSLFEIRTHARYNPAGSTPLNIVPGLVGTILTMTMLIFTALSVTRELERGTMESLLAMPITPLEIMLGKIVPYVLVGFVQATLIISAGVLMFGVPIVGSLALLAALSTLFIAANLSIGYTFSTVAQNQLQAMQMSMMFFLPNILLSGFMFPFAGMPVLAQWIGEALPLTHFIRIVRAIMLKGLALANLQYDVLALAGLMLIAMAIAVTRFRRTLD
jgi:ABC-2 type transport system permease protein